MSPSNAVYKKREHLAAESLPAEAQLPSAMKVKLRDLPAEAREPLLAQAAAAGLGPDHLRASVLVPHALAASALDPTLPAPATPILTVGHTWRAGSFGRVRPAWDGGELGVKELRLDVGADLERARGKAPKTSFSSWASVADELSLIRAPFTRLEARHLLRVDHKVFIFTQWLPLRLGDLVDQAHAKNVAPTASLHLAHEVLGQVGGQLADLHGNHVVHHDIKADNLLARAHGPLWLAVADFGLAARGRFREAFGPGVIGTPGYMSPEMVALKPYSYKTDVFSLAVVAIEVLGNRPLFSGHPQLSGRELLTALREDMADFRAWHDCTFWGLDDVAPPPPPAPSALTAHLDDAYARALELHPATAAFLFEEMMNPVPALRAAAGDVARFGQAARAAEPGAAAWGAELVRATHQGDPELAERANDFRFLHRLSEHIHV